MAGWQSAPENQRRRTRLRSWFNIRAQEELDVIEREFQHFKHYREQLGSKSSYLKCWDWSKWSNMVCSCWNLVLVIFSSVLCLSLFAFEKQIASLCKVRMWKASACLVLLGVYVSFWEKTSFTWLTCRARESCGRKWYSERECVGVVFRMRCFVCTCMEKTGGLWMKSLVGVNSVANRSGDRHEQLGIK